MSDVQPDASTRRRRRSRPEIWTSAVLLAAIIFFVVSGALTFNNIRTIRMDNKEVLHSHDAIIALDEVLSTVQDAETGQRGYLLTGDETYLGPYAAALANLPTQLATISDLVADDPAQKRNLAQLRLHVTAKLSELKRTVELRRAGNVDEAMSLVTSNQGKAEMDAIRAQLAAMTQEETRLRVEHLAEMEGAYRTALAGGILAAILGILLTLAIGFLLDRVGRARARQAWLQAGQVGLAQAILGDKTAEQVGEAVLAFLGRFLGVQAAVLYSGDDGRFQKTAQLGVPADAPVPESIRAGEGLLGDVVADGQILTVRDVPDGYLMIGSALGRDKPRHLVIAPFEADGAVNGVVELGFLEAPDERTTALLALVSRAAGVALQSARYRSALQELLEETQRQSEELQVQSEELRVSNEELEEQGRALKESQARLEQQQVELEQTNSQLEEQAQQLETQRDEIVRAATVVEAKARELEQASQYKTDFLANMSHELRTPLNSLLILSKLLADNPQENLTAEQVKFAQTIQSAGTDLLTLINDILDLSKIEAGHLEVRPETVSLQRLTADLRGTFGPVAAERGLEFQIEIDAKTPATVITDRQRVEQVLKNLLSNAFKFTEQGHVRLYICPDNGGRLVMAVSDTGIGISEDQKQSIFEAFRQADSTISRRFGGTGLGLSISRELARLLGGAISLESRIGEGSTFSLAIPLAYDPAQVQPRAEPLAAASPAALPARPAPSAAPVEDDRDRLTPTRRLLLVIEDDAAFAGVVQDVAHEMGFQCLIAATAGDAIHLAQEFRPQAVVLDVGLPDQSGLTVLDRLKQGDLTRHIPIHLISGTDHSQTALALGAVGYLLKPVQREDLAGVLRTLEEQLTRTMRRVLIVEDDQVQREAVSRLLASPDVEAVGVGTAAECLERLRSETFDCMVLDLSLPDASGFSLLETLSQDAGHSFPPVIVYTGHDLSPDDEQRLRRYSSSIIVKGAKSPERLLDEVSLFLHKVVADLPAEQQRMIRQARNRDAALEGRRILVVEDDIRNVYSLTNILEPRGATVKIARNGQEALDALEDAGSAPIDLVLMDVMMPVMDGLEATRRMRGDPRWAKLPVIMLTAKAMPDDHERCLAAGASDYMAKPLDVDKLLSLVRVWMPR